MTFMKNILLLASFSVFSLFSVAQSGKVIKDDNAQPRSVKGYHAIRVSGGIDLYLSQGNEETVVVSATNHTRRDKIRTVVEDGVLIISMEPGIDWGIHTNSTLKAYVSFTNLDALKASGGSDVYVDGVITTPKLNLSLSGGSDFKGGVAIGDMSIVQSGGSDITIKGTVSHLTLDAAGGSDFHGYELVTDNCAIVAGGGSDVHITVNKELNVNANGGSDVSYKGTAVVKNLHTGGSGSVTRKG
jgi:putative autotransporter adhesin-like protein